MKIGSLLPLAISYPWDNTVSICFPPHRFIMRILLLNLLLIDVVSAFTTTGARHRHVTMSLSSAPKEVDVSDLGLTMEDLEAPLPTELLQGIATTGYESTSRIPSVEDDACMWTELPNKMQATLAIPGLRGQPAMCLSVLTSKNTISVSAFGRVVWSCILRGEAKPETAVFECQEGSDMIPVIEYEVEKSDLSKRWGGFILQIGEDSIL